MTVRDFYQVASDSDKVQIEMNKKIVYRGRIRDIPEKYLDFVISHIGVNYRFFSFLLVL